MKIALVILHADPAKGGAERYTMDIAAALAGRGHAVSLLASTFAAVPPGVATIPLDARAATRLGQYRRFLDALDEYLASHSYDIVHAMLPVRRCDLYHPHAGIAAEALSTGHLKHRSALVASLSQLGTRLNRKRQAFAGIERDLLTSPTPPLVLCLSDYVKAAVRRHFALPDDRLFKLFNAVNLDRFNPDSHRTAGQRLRDQHGFSSTDCVALMIAQDFARKGLREAIEAMALIHHPRLRLLVVGKEDPTPYARLAHQRGLAAHIHFAGPTKEPETFYAAADFFLLPTRHDPCSLVVLEALAMGLPVISTTLNGACEIMTDGREGRVLADPADVEILAAALQQMLDPEQIRPMSVNALKLRPTLLQTTHINRLLEAYRSA